MEKQIISIIINFIVTGLLGYCVGSIKRISKKKKEKDDAILKDIQQLKETQMMDMRSDLSNKFFIYDAMEEVEDYLVMAFREKCERYFELGGDSWIHPMYEKSFKWKMKATGYLL